MIIRHHIETERMTHMDNKWWKKAVIYQIYPKSFQDTNGDGIGDIPGIIRRLPYLENLGIDAIWLSPVYCSPQEDNGYDVSDYQDIDPIFGSLADMDCLIAEAKKHHIRIMMDLVLNHTSDEHFWFQEALKGKDNPYHDYYIWRDGVEGCPPNDLTSGLGGSIWQWVPEFSQYYMHQFSVKQPDLNWQNPKVREELYHMIQWWIDRGVEGFRLDVIDHIGKVPDTKVMVNGPDLHTFIRELSQNTFGKAGLVSVGEAWSATPENTLLYTNPDGSELSMIFYFEHIVLDQQPDGTKWDLMPLPLLRLKETINKWQTKLHGKGWSGLFWDNHDLPRIVSRWGNDSDAYRNVSAKMLATLLHCLEGTPYIYQGEELGMTNIPLSLEQYDDLETLTAYKKLVAAGRSEQEILASLYAKSRENARTPMQWDDGPQAGFTTGTPWMPLNPNYTKINAYSQIYDTDSVFSYYKKLIRLRKEIPVIADGSFHMLLPDDTDIFAYQRINDTQTLTVICNFYEKEREIDTASLLPESSTLCLSNYSEIENINILRPYEARIYLK